MQEVAHELEPLAQDADISLEAEVEPGVQMNADVAADPPGGEPAGQCHSLWAARRACVAEADR